MAPMFPFLPSLLLAVGGLVSPAWGGSGLSYPDCETGPLKSNVVCDPTASPLDRATALVAAMSNADKLKNLVNNSPGFPSLGLAAYQWWNEALHGVAINRGITWGGAFSAATQFPQAITTGAAFDDELIFSIGETIGTEARAFANAGRAHLDFWTPNINPYRDPRWGRGSETPGEDARHLQRYVDAFVRGMQGNGTTRRVIATCKHFAAYDLEDSGGVTRFNFDAKVGLQDLAEYYLPPFQQCARDAAAGSVMCSYNAVNGVPACADDYLLQTVLRDHWNWTAAAHHPYVVSDCDAVYYVGPAGGRGHAYKPTQAEATAAAFDAGTDNICWATYGDAPDPAAAFGQGLFSQATLDRMLRRQYEGLIRAGLFDGPQGAYRDLGAADVDTPAARALALRAAEAGIVLLKNDGALLPLTSAALAAAGTIAMVGFWAADASVMLGGYSGTPPFRHDPVTAAKALGLTVVSASGPVSASYADSAPALAAARQAGLILYFGGIDSTVEAESHDRTSIAWPAAQLAEIRQLAALGKPVVVIKMGTHVDDTPLLALPNVRAILWAGYPGQDGGTAVLNVLLGKTAPAGRLPITMYPAAYVDRAPMTNMALRPDGTYPGRTYRWYDDAVFPFGYGLHYTNFSVAVGPFPPSLSIQALLANCSDHYLDRCPLPAVPLNVTNTGAVASDYAALAFLSGSFGPAPHPLRTLASYTRLAAIAPGATQAASLSWTAGCLARVDKQGNRVLYPGTYTLVVDEPHIANMTFVLTGTKAVLDKWPQPPTKRG